MKKKLAKNLEVKKRILEAIKKPCQTKTKGFWFYFCRRFSFSMYSILSRRPTEDTNWKGDSNKKIKIQNKKNKNFFNRYIGYIVSYYTAMTFWTFWVLILKKEKKLVLILLFFIINKFVFNNFDMLIISFFITVLNIVNAVPYSSGKCSKARI